MISELPKCIHHQGCTDTRQFVFRKICENAKENLCFISMVKNNFLMEAREFATFLIDRLNCVRFSLSKKESFSLIFFGSFFIFKAKRTLSVFVPPFFHNLGRPRQSQCSSIHSKVKNRQTFIARRYLAHFTIGPQPAKRALQWRAQRGKAGAAMDLHFGYSLCILRVPT